MKAKTIAGMATATALAAVGLPGLNSSLHHVAHAATTTAQQAFLNDAAAQALSVSSQYGLYPSVQLAQAIVESGWGQSSLATQYHNLFGIKGSYNGQTVNMSTTEYVNGQATQINDNFRAYPDYASSFADNAALLRISMGTFYNGTWVENANSYADATANGLQGKYATAPNYASSLNNIITSYNLTQYDPTISTAVKSLRAVANAAIKSVPAANAYAGNPVGSTTAGTVYTVDKTITYPNGVVYYHIQGQGWVDGSALNAASTQAPQQTKPSQAKPAASTKPASAASYSMSKVSFVKKINYVPGYGIAVWTSPVGGKTTGQFLKHGTSWKVSGQTTVNGATWYKVGTNQWIEAKYTVNPSEAVKSSEPAKSQAPSSFVKATGIVKVSSAVKNSAVWSSPTGAKTGQLLPSGSRWKTSGYQVVDGQKWYKVGTNQWIKAADVASDNATAPAQVKPASQASVKSTGVVVIKEAASVFTLPNAGMTSRLLQPKTSWKYFATATVAGHTWFNLGGSQWVYGDLVSVK